MDRIDESTGRQSWRGGHIALDVLHSLAGVATTIAVTAGEEVVLFDAGDGALRDLLAMPRDVRALQGVVFTHGHYDHVGGLHSLLGFLRMLGREEPFAVVAPAGCREVRAILDGFRSCYPGTMPCEIAFREISPGEEIALGGLSITSFPVVHCGSVRGAGIFEPIPASGYRIARGGETVVISGDTGDCPSLREIVRGADLAVLEATSPEGAAVEPGYLERVHLSEGLAAEIGATAKAWIPIHRRRKRTTA